MQEGTEATQRGEAKPQEHSGKFLYKIGDLAYKQLSVKSYVTAPITVWISGFLLGLSCILYVTAFVTTGWGVIREAVTDRVIDVGLWHSCSQNGGGCQKIENQTGTYRLCQSLACFSLIGLLLSVLVLTLCCVSRHMRRKPYIQLSSFLLRPISAIFLLLTFAIYGGTWNKPNYIEPTYNTHLSYSHSLTIASFTFEFLASFLMALEWRRWHQLTREQDAKTLSESREHVLPQNDSRFDDRMDEAVMVSNAKSPYELFQQFTEENNGPQDVQTGSAQHYQQAGYYKDHYDDRDKNKNGKSQNQPSEHRNNRPHGAVASNAYQELGDTERQKPNTKHYYNEGFNHKEPEHRNGQVSNLSPQTQYSCAKRHDHRKTANVPVQSESRMTSVNTVSAAVEVHHTPKYQSSAKPKAPQKPKAPSVPSAGTVHSYENIPDGQTSRSGNVNYKEGNPNRNHTRRDYNQHHQQVPVQGRNLAPTQYNKQQTSNTQSDVASTSGYNQYNRKNPPGDTATIKPVQNTIV